MYIVHSYCQTTVNIIGPVQSVFIPKTRNFIIKRSNKLKYLLRIVKSELNLRSQEICLKMAEMNKFTLAQVKEHNKEKDVWIVIRDKVYDVSKFLSEVRFFSNI